MEAPSDESIILLKECLPALCDAVAPFVADTPEAREARRLLSQSSGGVYDSFHTTVDESFRILCATLANWTTSDVLYGQKSTDAQIEAYSLLKTLNHYFGLDTTEPRRTVDVTCLKCPPILSRRKLEDQLQSCIGAFEDERLGQNLIDQFRPMQEWTHTRRFCENLEHLYSILAERFDCECAPDHSLKVSFSLRKASRSRFCLHFQHDDESWSVFEIKLLPGHSTTRDGSITIQAPGSVDPALVDSSATDHTPLCRILSDRDSGITIVANDGEYIAHLEDVHTETCSSRASRQSFSSSSVAFSDHLSFPAIAVEDRLKVAALVAYAYLDLSGGYCVSDRASELGVWFKAEKESRQCLALQPFLLLGMTSHGADNYNSRTDMARIFCRARPSLPALGKLLLEIGLHKTLTWNLTDAKAEAKTILSEAYVSVVEACLQPPPELRLPGKFDRKARTVFLERVAKGLQYLLRKNRVVSLPDIFRIDPRVNRRARSAGAERQASRPSGLAASSRPRSPPMQATMAAPTERSTLPLSTEFGDWMERFDQHVRPLFPQDETPTRRTRVAILDTGANLTSRCQHMSNGGVQGYWSWCEVPGSSQGRRISSKYSCQPDETGAPPASDADGHGSYLMALLMHIAPECEIYICKVFESKNDVVDGVPDDITSQRIANAIIHAATKWKVDIISMSFGFKEEIEVIENAIDSVRPQTVLIAAASNEGGNEPIRWPASCSSVICMNAAGGMGATYDRNPTPQDDVNRLSTLGIDISVWNPNNDNKRKAGTSYATVVAAGIATLVIDIMEQYRHEYVAWKTGAVSNPTPSSQQSIAKKYETRLRRLRRSEVMSKVFMRMAPGLRGDYKYITPWNILKDTALDSINDLCSCIDS